MSEEKKTVELNDKELEKVTGGEYIDENGHVFAYAPGFFYVINSGYGIFHIVENCYVEAGVNKYKLGIYGNGKITSSTFLGYEYFTEAELAYEVSLHS